MHLPNVWSFRHASFPAKNLHPTGWNRLICLVWGLTMESTMNIYLRQLPPGLVRVLLVLTKMGRWFDVTNSCLFLFDTCLNTSQDDLPCVVVDLRSAQKQSEVACLWGCSSNHAVYIYLYIYAPTNLVYSSTIKFIQTIQVALECGANPMLICYSWVPSEICGGWRCIQAAWAMDWRHLRWRVLPPGQFTQEYQF